MKIILRPLAVMDLSLSYARPMEGNKIKHYTVRYRYSDEKVDALALVKEYILKEENLEASEVEFILEARASFLIPNAPKNDTIFVKEIDILADFPKTEKALNQKSVKALSYTDIFYPLKHRIVDALAVLINPLLSAINSALRKLQGLSIESVLIENKGLFLPVVPSYGPERTLHFARYISYAFWSNDFERAKQELASDLNNLASKGLIKGHLTKPTLMALADNYGGEEQLYVVFCFPIIDSKKLEELIGRDLAWSRKPLIHVGVLGEEIEGGVHNLDDVNFDNKYEIERIEVSPPGVLTYEQERKTLIDAFEASIPSVNEAAAVTREMIKTYPEELAKAEKELSIAVESYHSRALVKSRKKALKKVTKKTKKKVVKKKASKKAVRRK